MTVPIRVLIMGAAGRDFHNFNVTFRNNHHYTVICFTAAQISGIANRTYPRVLAGKRYPKGIPIYPETELETLIKTKKIQQVVLAYSDLPHTEVMHKASRVLATGADFVLLGPDATMLTSKKPVIAVTAVRTGAGKSQTTRFICRALRKRGFRVVAIRHPMPYGNLEDQIMQRFTGYDDLDEQNTTIEEREEYEPLIDEGIIVYAGVDYEKILRSAEKEADVIVWDGGNNDFPFYRPDLHIVICDPHRPGHELLYHPGETNFRMANIAIINKEKSAKHENVEIIKQNLKAVNPKALVIDADSLISVSDPNEIRHRKVLVVEDGPTLTHGGMAFGAGTLAAKQYRGTIVDPRPHLTGSIKEIYNNYPHLGMILPAMGYSKEQLKELETIINNTPCDAVVAGTPIDLRRVLKTNKPIVRVRYELVELGHNALMTQIMKVVKKNPLKTR